ncbi:zinc ribbon domain-containing protein [Paenibacillus sp. HB172176]|uniref:zinc ribbon domain-containing protein n=1 Tax=Paenibacillus sp. HB172176 TaxID=2493690 RepID=UPI00143C1187|nr:zinc ribbon domain-containing protein [Paenibacillus sp. HB172176]
MYYFKKKIQCTNCSKNFRGITERSKKKYICSGHSNYGNCIRWRIDESWLLDLIHRHFIIDKLKNYEITSKTEAIPDLSTELIAILIERVESVKVNPVDKDITIYFKDGSKTYMSNNRHAYWTDDEL